MRRRGAIKGPKAIGGPQRLTAADFGYNDNETAEEPAAREPLFDGTEIRLAIQVVAAGAGVMVIAFSAGILAGLVHLGYTIASGGF